jgi:hypothetical protein
MVADDVRESRSKIVQHAAKQREEHKRTPSSADSAETDKGNKTAKSKKKTDTRKATAKEAKLPERKLRTAHDVKKLDPKIADMVRAGTVTLNEGKKLASLPATGRKIAIDAVQNGMDVRSAIRLAKKQDYNAKVSAAKPKAFEGTYRILYADPPWNMSGLIKRTNTATPKRHCRVVGYFDSGNRNPRITHAQICPMISTTTGTLTTMANSQT